MNAGFLRKARLLKHPWASTGAHHPAPPASPAHVRHMHHTCCTTFVAPPAVTIGIPTRAFHCAAAVERSVYIFGGHLYHREKKGLHKFNDIWHLDTVRVVPRIHFPLVVRFIHTGFYLRTRGSGPPSMGLPQVPPAPARATLPPWWRFLVAACLFLAGLIQQNDAWTTCGSLTLHRTWVAVIHFWRSIWQSLESMQCSMQCSMRCSMR